MKSLGSYSAAIALAAGLATPVFGQLQWSAYDGAGSLLSASVATGGDATYGGSVTFTIPALSQRVFITKRFVPISLAAASSKKVINFTWSASGGLASGGRCMGWGLFSSAGTASLADDVGYFGMWNASGPYNEPYYHSSGSANLFSGTKPGQGGTYTGSPVANVTYTNQLQLNMNSAATGISLGTGGSSLASAGVAIVGPSVTQYAYINPVTPLVGSVSTFDEFGFMFANTTASDITITLANLSLVPVNPVITTQPQSVGASPGDTASFTVGLNANTATPVSYQWYWASSSATNLLADGLTANGSLVSGSTSATLWFANAQAADSGNVFVVVSNAYATAASAPAQLLVSATPVAPIISSVTPNVATVVAATGTTNIVVSAIGVPSPTFYWYDNNNSLIQASSSPNLALSNLQLANAGTYTVTASNAASAVSSNFTLSVIVTPAISGQPTNLLLNLGDPASFSVTASGIPDPIFRWYKNGTNIAGATGTNYSIASVAYTDIATYTVVVSNAAGAVTSSGAVLAINSPMVGTPLSPANGAINLCYDTPLYLSFNQTPAVGKTGKVRIYNAASPATPVDTIDLSLNNASKVQAHSAFPGDSQAFNYFPIIVTGNTAAIYPHGGVLAPGQTYYVTIEPGVIVDANAAYYTGIASSSAWQFSTRASGPANSTNLVVAADGSGDFLTVQGAVDSIPLNNTAYTVVNIRNGAYVEIVNVSAKNNITFRGQSRANTLIKYANNNNLNGTTHARMTFKVNANDIAIENLTISNSTVQGGSQAEALMLESKAARFILNNATVSSLQDTILANVNTSQGYFYKSAVRGNFDYIWGGGNLFFDQCVIHTVTNTSSTSYNLTAARTDFGTTSTTGNWKTPDGTKWSSNGFSFVSCTLEADAGVKNVSLAGANGTAGGQSSWAFCQIDTNAYVGPTSTISNTYNIWHYQSVDLLGNAVAFSNVVTLASADSRVAAMTNISVWLNGWQPKLLPNILGQPAAQIVSAGLPASFTVQATGVPEPSYQWLKNGAPIAGATAANLSFAAAVRSDAADYSVVVSNAAGAVTSQVATLTYTGNAAPIAAASSYARQAGYSLKIPIPGSLATRWTDADGDTVALAGAISSTNGATVAYDGSYVYYSSASDMADEIDYTVADGQGGAAAGIISINVVTGPTAGTAQAVALSGNSATVTFAGIPNYLYQIQRSTNLTDWVTLSTTNAPATGLFLFTDTFADLGGIAPAAAFYRTANQ
jgi:hypothetical protein